MYFSIIFHSTSSKFHRSALPDWWRILHCTCRYNLATNVLFSVKAANIPLVLTLYIVTLPITKIVYCNHQWHKLYLHYLIRTTVDKECFCSFFCFLSVHVSWWTWRIAAALTTHKPHISQWIDRSGRQVKFGPFTSTCERGPTQIILHIYTWVQNKQNSTSC